MLTLQNDPAGITGRRRVAWDFSQTMQENIAAHLDSGADCELSINGLKVDPLTDARLDAPPSVADFVTVTRRPAADPATWYYLAILAFAVYTYTQIPKLPPDGLAKQSPNNSLTGQTNVARAYQAIPDVYGNPRCWPDLIQPSTEEYINNVKKVTEWLCVSRGTGDLTAVKYADTPIDDIDGAAKVEFYPASSPNAYPELNDTTLTNVVETFASPEVNGQELSYTATDNSISTSADTLGLTGTTFQLTCVDGPLFTALKAAIPVGASIQLFIGGAPADTVADCTITGYSTAGPDVIFDVTAPGGYGFGNSTFDVIITPDIAGDSSATTVGPLTMRIDDADQLWFNWVFLRGLKGSVAVRAEWWQIDGAGTEIGGTREFKRFTRSADTYDQQFFTEKITPAAGAGRYRIQFTRQTAPTPEGADVAKLEAVYAVRNFATKTLPGCTVIKVTTTATAQATGFSERRFNCRFARHVRELASDTLSASRNFARIMAHVWTLAGEDITELDATKLAAINADLGEDSPLLRFDGTFDDADMSLGERLQRVAYHARCTLWRDGTKWTVTREQAQQYPELQLDYRNLAAGGESSISYASHLPASYDGIELEYVDEETLAKKAYVRLDISTGAVVIGSSRNPLKVALPACATQEQAENRAHLEARRLLYQRTAVTDTALSDAGSLGIGSLIRWIDPNDFAGDDGLQAGEVMAIDSLTITTSEPIDWKGATTGRVLFTGVDGLRLAAPVVCTPVADQPKQMTLASVPAGLYVRDVDRQLGSRYAFAVGLTEAETEAAGLYVVTSLRPGSDRTVSLAFSNYDDRMFEED